jgi:hypothetical protein
VSIGAGPRVESIGGGSGIGMGIGGGGDVECVPTVSGRAGCVVSDAAASLAA